MNKLLSVVGVLCIILPACRKGDNPRIPDLIRVPVPLLTKDSSKHLSISAQDAAAFSAAFTVAMHFPNEPGPKSAESVAGTENFVAPCHGALSVKLRYSVEGGSSTPLVIRMKR